jgi:hypothetical protein
MRMTIFSTTANSEMVADFVDAGKIHNSGSWRIPAIQVRAGASQSLETMHY